MQCSNLIRCGHRKSVRGAYSNERSASRNKAGFPLGGILLCGAEFFFVFFISSEKPQGKQKFRSARKIPPSGKQA